MREPVGDRVRAVREARQEKQPEFAAAMTRAAKRLKLKDRYDNSTVSKMESGMRRVTLEDVAVVASLDPDRRGVLWLAWAAELRAQLADLGQLAPGSRRSAAQIPVDYGEPVDAPASAPVTAREAKPAVSRRSRRTG